MRLCTCTGLSAATELPSGVARHNPTHAPVGRSDVAKASGATGLRSKGVYRNPRLAASGGRIGLAEVKNLI
jgi:hypothetical protein